MYLLYIYSIHVTDFLMRAILMINMILLQVTVHLNIHTVV